MITYAEARTALEMIEEVERKHERRAKIVGIEKLEPQNRKQRRIKDSKERRKR